MIARLLGIYRPYWPWVALSLGAALLTVLANVALMASSGWFITAMAVAGLQGVSINYFAPAALIRACAIVRTLGRYGERLISHETTFRLLASLRVWLYRRLEPLSPALLAGFHSGDLATRMRADIDRLESVYLRLLTPMAVALLTSVTLTALLARTATALAVLELAGMSAAALMVPALAARLAARPSAARVGLTAALHEAAVDAVQGMGEWLTLGEARQQFRNRFLGHGRALVAAQTALGNLAGLAQAGHLLAANLTLWGAVVVGVPMVRAGGLDGPDLVMICLAVLAGFEAAAPLPAAFLALAAVRESAARLFGLGEPAAADGDDISPTAAPPPAMGLEVRALCFRHGPEGPALLDRISFSLPPGGRMALLGPVGCGKSTLVDLLTGLKVADSGTIVLGGQELRPDTARQARRCFAVAAQDAPLFTGTLRSNLALARPDADEPALWRVLAIAQLAPWVRTLPEGLDTAVGEAGLTLSGGQARRLVVARALLRDAPILVLDEPGEGLDPATERAMLDAVIDALGRRSLILITHRPAGLARMDKLIRLG